MRNVLVFGALGALGAALYLLYQDEREGRAKRARGAGEAKSARPTTYYATCRDASHGQYGWFGHSRPSHDEARHDAEAHNESFSHAAYVVP